MNGLYVAVCCLLLCRADSQTGTGNDKQIDDIQSQLSTIMTQLATVTARLDKALEENQALTNNLTSLHQHVAALENLVNATDKYAIQIDERLYRLSNSHRERLEYMREAFDERIDEVDASLAKMRRKTAHVDGRVTAVNGSLEELRATVTDTGDLLSYVIDTVNQKDAFVAYTNNFAILVEEGGIIPFSHTLFQVGDGFDTHTHMFTCQHSGLYMFSTSVVNYFYWHKASAHIVKDGDPISASVHADTFAREWNQGSVTVVTECLRGQQVWVRCGNKSRIHGGDEIQSYTQFMGMLLQSHV